MPKGRSSHWQNRRSPECDTIWRLFSFAARAGLKDEREKKSLIFVTRASKTKNGLLAASVQFRLFLINLGLQVQTNVSIRSYTWHLRGVAQAHSSILVTDWKKERRRDKEGRRHFLLKALKSVCHFSSDSHITYADCTQKKHGKQKLKQKKTW